MNDLQLQNMVAWYALDLLDRVEKDAFAVELIHQEWLQAELNQITETLACLSYLAPPVTPAPDEKPGCNAPTGRSQPSGKGDPAGL